MSDIKMNIWDREFVLDVTYDCYSDEEISQKQKDAIEKFPSAENEITKALVKVKEYCLNQNKKEIGEDNISNIFKYVVPKYLFVPRDDKNRLVAIMCKYKYDAESGLAIVFRNEKLAQIGKQDIVL